MIDPAALRAAGYSLAPIAARPDIREPKRGWPTWTVVLTCPSGRVVVVEGGEGNAWIIADADRRRNLLAAT